MIGLTGLAAMISFCFVVPLPTREMLPWLAAASVLHTTYQLVLIRSYNASNFAIAYPIARGIAPMATAVLGVSLLGDRITTIGLVGIVMVSSGIMLIVVGRAVTRVGLIAAMITGLLTTVYTVVDAHAIRLASQAMTFIAWFFVLDGLMMFPIFVVSRWGQVRMLLRAEGRHGLLAGLTSLISFGAALLALRMNPVGIVSALRETSVLFGVIIAAKILKEPVGLQRACGAVIIVVGAVLIVAKVT
jgi:drug/metabolite transporter (DMT)-like permease